MCTGDYDMNIEEYNAIKCNQSEYMILTYGLSTKEKIALAAISMRMYAYKDNPLKKTRMRVYVASCVEDIIAIPCLTAFVNFDALDMEEIEMLYNIINDAEKFDPDYIVEGRTWNTIYALNCREYPHIKTPNSIKKIGDIIENRKQLKLLLLSEYKDMEGLKQYNSTSDRIYRILTIYKDLLDGKVVTLDRVNSSSDYDPIKQRQFMKDIEIIRTIVGFEQIKYVKVFSGYKYIKGED